MELKLKSLRKRMGMTQEELAKAIGASKRQVGAWERSENDCPLDYAAAICDVLNCSLDEIAGRQAITDAIYTLSPDEVYIIDTYRKASDDVKQKIQTATQAYYVTSLIQTGGLDAVRQAGIPVYDKNSPENIPPDPSTATEGTLDIKIYELP